MAIGWLTGCGGAPESPPPSAPASPAKSQAQPPADPAAEGQAKTPAPTPNNSDPQSSSTSNQPKQETVSPSPKLASDNNPSDPSAAKPISASPGLHNNKDPNQDSASETPPAKPRPEALADWKEEDFLSAKRESDSRLVEAIQNLGERHVGDPSIVKILKAILAVTKPDEQPAEGNKPDQPDPMSSRGHSDGGMSMSIGGGGNSHRRGATTPSQQVISAAIDALGQNDTDQARELLREIVAGEFITDYDPVATPEAMFVLLDQDTPENQALMLRVLIEPEKLREGTISTSDQTPDPSSQRGMRHHGQDPEKRMTADDLYQQAKEVVDTMASESFRIKLIKFLLSKQATTEQRKALVPMLSKPVPENAAAQLLVYQAPVKAEQLKPAFEKYFADLSSVALGHVLGALADKENEEEEAEEDSDPKPTKKSDDGWGGIKPKGSQSGKRKSRRLTSGEGSSDGGGSGGRRTKYGANVSSPELDDPAVIYPLAAKLWAPKTAASVLERLKEITSLGEEENTALGLARTMPVDRVRAGLYSILRARFEDGPIPLSNSTSSNGRSIPGGVMVSLSNSTGHHGDAKTPDTFLDPGFLVVVKSLPIDKKARRSSKPKRKPSSRLGVSDGGSGGTEENNDSEEEPETPSEQWLAASQNLAKLLCQQCQAAAQAPPEDLKKLPKIPVKPHAKAEVKLLYDLKVPDDLGEKMGNFKIDPLEIHYVRIEEKAQLSRLVKHYRRVTRAKPSETEDNEIWFDTLKKGATPGSKESCDVIITSSGGHGLDSGTGTARRGRQKEPEVSVVVEILTIEMKDPTGS